MVVKDRVGRRRYLSFLAPDEGWSRRTFEQRLARPDWRLTVFEGRRGILRVPHTDQAAAAGALTTLGCEVLTVSGTILQAKRRTGLV